MERAADLKLRIKELQLELEQKNQLISQYEAIGNAADEKINALNNIHAEKVRSLMNSIQIIKKENANLQKLQKEHKRSELIDKLNSEIKEQDLVIDTLRKLLKNDSLADQEIIKALNSGPPQVKALSREELKIELKKLQDKLANLKKAPAQEDMKDSKVSKASNSTLDQSQAGEELLNANDQLIKKIESLKNENEELKLQLRAEEDIRMKFEQEIDEKSEEINQLEKLKADMKAQTQKYEKQQKELEDLQKVKMGKDLVNINRDLKNEELEVKSKAESGNQRVKEKDYIQQIEDLRVGLDEEQKSKSELDQQIKLQNMRLKENDRIIKENSQKMAEKVEKIKKLENDLQTRELKLKQVEQEKNNQIKNQQDQIKKFEQSVDQYKEEVEKLKEDGKSMDIFRSSIKDKNMTDFIFEYNQAMKLKDDYQSQLQLYKEKSKNLYSDKDIEQLHNHYKGQMSKLLAGQLVQKQTLQAPNDISSNLSGDANEMHASQVSSNISNILQPKQTGAVYIQHPGLIQNNQLQQISSNIHSVLDSEDGKVPSDQLNQFNSDVSVTESLLNDHQMQQAGGAKQVKQEQKEIKVQTKNDISSDISVILKDKPNHPADVYGFNSDVSLEISQQSQVQEGERGNQKKQNIQQQKSSVKNLSQSKGNNQNKNDISSNVSGGASQIDQSFNSGISSISKLSQNSRQQLKQIPSVKQTTTTTGRKNSVKK